MVPGLLRDRESAPAPEETYAVCPADLNRLMDCSQMNSVMDTAFMLVCLKGQREWISLAFIYDIEKCEIQGYASVRYVLDQDVSPFCLPDPSRMRLLELEPWLKHLHGWKKGPLLEVTISPVFKPTSYGSKESALRGKWAMTKNEQGVNDVRAILQMPWSNAVLKQRLIKHEGELEHDIQYAKEHPDGRMDDRDHKNYINWLETTRSRLRDTVKQWPAVPPDHIFCVASVSCSEKAKHTVVSESEDRYSAGELQPRSVLKAIKESGAGRSVPLDGTWLSGWKPRSMPSPNFSLVEGFPGRPSATKFNNRLRTDIE
jgi:hypothetical protein